MKLPFTQKQLQDWSGTEVFRQARQLWEKGAVKAVDLEDGVLHGTVEWGHRRLRTAAKIHADGTAENQCPCYDNRERGIICAHVIALGLEMVRRAHDPDRERNAIEEERKALRQARMAESAFLRRAPKGTAGTIPAALRLGLAGDWSRNLPVGPVPIQCHAVLGDEVVPVDRLPRERTYTFDETDDAVLYVLEDICEGAARAHIDLCAVDFINLLDLMQGRELVVGDGDASAMINSAAIPSRVVVDLDRENGELIVMIHTEVPYAPETEFPIYVVARSSGYVFGAGNFWPLEKVLPVPFHGVYGEPVVVGRPAVPGFMTRELPVLAEHIAIQTDLSADLFAMEPEVPRPLLHIKGSPAALAATLYAEYGTLALAAGRPDPRGHFAHPDPDDLLRYTVRNPDREQHMIADLSETGFAGPAGDELESIVGTRAVLNFLGGHLPALRRAGWRVEVEGRIAETLDSAEYVMPVVHIGADEDANWFDVRFEYDDGQGGSLSAADIQRAIRRGDSYLESGGRTLLLDANAIESMNGVFEDCAAGEGTATGSFRLGNIHSAYVQASLNALDGVDVEASPQWRRAAEHHDRGDAAAPVAIPHGLGSILRPYQKVGIEWLGFLQQNGFGGILADEMGLGKTLQTLVWLHSLRRHPEAADGRPALIVCPTSLVENWADEAARFVPDLDVMLLSGAKRDELWARVRSADLVVTSYALLRRDIARHQEVDYIAAVLDEAQHIKNHSTQNAQAAKKLRSLHRIVLTGTPMENSVTDLWSIMDFLMPGYLGGHKAFRERYELPIARADRDGEEAQARLRRKLKPFLLRRLKRDVARDLPPKIQRVAKFSLSPDQKKVYLELLQASQRKLTDMVSRQGFQKSRMEILKTLLRLRQTCCHLDLLKLPGLSSDAPSAKMDLFFELMDEALDGGHRILVFSQFVEMLTILRKELDSRSVAYCYLDGSTKNRMEQVREFNTNRRIPAFLISLKAGGTGLNLTGADMVIHFDPWWNPAVEDQATDRAYRIGQKRTVYSVKLIARDSVEENVLALQQKKRAVIDATITSDEQVMSKLEWDDIRELLAL